MALWPKASSWPAVLTRSHRKVPSAVFTPSLAAMITLDLLFCRSSTRFRKFSGSKGTSGSRIISGPSQSGPAAMQAAPASQPAWRPMISATVTLRMSYTEASAMTSFRMVAMYLAAEP